MNSRMVLWSICVAWVFTGFVIPNGSGTVSIVLTPSFYGQPVVLGKQLYHTSQGDSLYLDAVRFYVSAVELTGKGNRSFKEPDSYHLIDCEEAASQIISLYDVPAGQFDSLIFWVGTDSVVNVSGALGGDLDPSLGMYWAWNTGYINIKLEGRSTACKTLHHAFEFHLGGYMPPHKTIRRVALPLKNMRVEHLAVTQVPVQADLGRFFEHISLASTNQVMIPSKMAADLADYFSGVFY